MRGADAMAVGGRLPGSDTGVTGLPTRKPASGGTNLRGDEGLLGEDMTSEQPGQGNPNQEGILIKTEYLRNGMQETSKSLGNKHLRVNKHAVLLSCSLQSSYSQRRLRDNNFTSIFTSIFTFSTLLSCNLFLHFFHRRTC